MEEHTNKISSAFDDIFSGIQPDRFATIAEPRKPKLPTGMSLKETEKKWGNQVERIRERTYDVNLISSQKVTVQMPPYEPLLDEHLQDYFNSPNTRKHLMRLGLIDADGTIISEKAFKKNQIRLDKKAHNDALMRKEFERELNYDIQLALKIEAQNKQQLDTKLKGSSGTKEQQDFLSRFPVVMHKTAILYSQGSGDNSAEAMLLYRLREQSPKKLEEMGLSRKEINNRIKKLEEKKNRPLESYAKKRPQSSKPSKPLGDHWAEPPSLTDLFDKANKAYKDGQVEAAEQNLIQILQVIQKRGQETVRNQRMQRPKSARPTRESNFPTTSDFSDFEEDSGAPIDDLDKSPKAETVVEDESKPQRVKSKTLSFSEEIENIDEAKSQKHSANELRDAQPVSILKGSKQLLNEPERDTNEQVQRGDFSVVSSLHPSDSASHRYGSDEVSNSVDSSDPNLLYEQEFEDAAETKQSQESPTKTEDMYDQEFEKEAPKEYEESYESIVETKVSPETYVSGTSATEDVELAAYNANVTDTVGEKSSGVSKAENEKDGYESDQEIESKPVRQTAEATKPQSARGSNRDLSEKLSSARPSVKNLNGQGSKPSSARASLKDLSEKPASARGSIRDVSEKAPSVRGSVKQLSEKPPSARGSNRDLSDKPPSARASVKDLLEKPTSVRGSVKNIAEDKPQSTRASVRDLSEKPSSASGSAKQLAEDKPPSLRGSVKQLAEQTQDQTDKGSRSSVKISRPGSAKQSKSDLDRQSKADLEKQSKESVKPQSAKSSKAFLVSDDKSKPSSQRQSKQDLADKARSTSDLSQEQKSSRSNLASAKSHSNQAIAQKGSSNNLKHSEKESLRFIANVGAHREVKKSLELLQRAVETKLPDSVSSMDHIQNHQEAEKAHQQPEAKHQEPQTEAHQEPEAKIDVARAVPLPDSVNASQTLDKESPQEQEPEKRRSIIDSIRNSIASLTRRDKSSKDNVQEAAPADLEKSSTNEQSALESVACEQPALDKAKSLSQTIAKPEEQVPFAKTLSLQDVQPQEQIPKEGRASQRSVHFSQTIQYQEPKPALPEPVELPVKVMTEENVTQVAEAIQPVAPSVEKPQSARGSRTQMNEIKGSKDQLSQSARGSFKQLSEDKPASVRGSVKQLSEDKPPSIRGSVKHLAEDAQPETYTEVTQENNQDEPAETEKQEEPLSIYQDQGPSEDVHKAIEEAVRALSQPLLNETEPQAAAEEVASIHGLVKHLAEEKPASIRGSVKQLSEEKAQSVKQLSGEKQGSVQNIQEEKQSSVQHLAEEKAQSVKHLDDEHPSSVKSSVKQLSEDKPSSVRGSVKQLAQERPQSARGSVKNLSEDKPASVRGSVKQLSQEKTQSIKQLPEEKAHSVNHLEDRPASTRGSVKHLAEERPQSARGSVKHLAEEKAQSVKHLAESKPSSVRGSVKQLNKSASKDLAQPVASEPEQPQEAPAAEHKQETADSEPVQHQEEQPAHVEQTTVDLEPVQHQKEQPAHVEQATVHQDPVVQQRAQPETEHSLSEPVAEQKDSAPVQEPEHTLSEPQPTSDGHIHEATDPVVEQTSKSLQKLSDSKDKLSHKDSKSNVNKSAQKLTDADHETGSQKQLDKSTKGSQKLKSQPELREKAGSQPLRALSNDKLAKSDSQKIHGSPKQVNKSVSFSNLKDDGKSMSKTGSQTNLSQTLDKKGSKSNLARGSNNQLKSGSKDKLSEKNMMSSLQSLKDALRVSQSLLNNEDPLTKETQPKIVDEVEPTHLVQRKSMRGSLNSKPMMEIGEGGESEDLHTPRTADELHPTLLAKRSFRSSINAKTMSEIGEQGSEDALKLPAGGDVALAKKRSQRLAKTSQEPPLPSKTASVV